MKKLIVPIIVALLIGGIGATVLIYVSGHLGSGNQVYTISQSDIDTAVNQVKDNPNWCLGNALVTVGDYRVGDTVNEVIVLHNGNDAIGSFTVQSESDYINLSDPNPVMTLTTITTAATSSTAIIPSNITSLANIILRPMATKVINMTFTIPTKTQFTTGYTFMIDVHRTASTDQMILSAYQQKWKVY